MIIRFYNNDDLISIDSKDCINLELILNKFIIRHLNNFNNFNNFDRTKWDDLGDILYAWGSKTNYKNLMTKTSFLVGQEEIDWLRNQLQ